MKALMRHKGLAGLGVGSFLRPQQHRLLDLHGRWSCHAVKSVVRLNICPPPSESLVERRVWLGPILTSDSVTSNWPPASAGSWHESQEREGTNNIYWRALHRGKGICLKAR
eukprot:1161122-Pelagomonas_calceolata.AAC.4